MFRSIYYYFIIACITGCISNKNNISDKDDISNRSYFIHVSDTCIKGTYKWCQEIKYKSTVKSTECRCIKPKINNPTNMDYKYFSKEEYKLIASRLKKYFINNSKN